MSEIMCSTNRRSSLNVGRRGSVDRRGGLGEGEQQAGLALVAGGSVERRGSVGKLSSVAAGRAERRVPAERLLERRGSLARLNKSKVGPAERRQRRGSLGLIDRDGGGKTPRRSSLTALNDPDDLEDASVCALRHPTRVTFAARAQICVVAGLWEFTPEEKRAAWNDRFDIKQVKKDNVRTIAALRTTKAMEQVTDGAYCDDYDEEGGGVDKEALEDAEDGFCLRGLEHMRHVDSYRTQIAIRKQVVRTVLDVQAEFLEVDGPKRVPSTYALAEASRTVSAPSRKMAVQKGAYDAAEVSGERVALGLPPPAVDPLQRDLERATKKVGAPKSRRRHSFQCLEVPDEKNLSEGSPRGQRDCRGSLGGSSRRFAFDDFVASPADLVGAASSKKKASSDGKASRASGPRRLGRMMSFRSRGKGGNCAAAMTA